MYIYSDENGRVRSTQGIKGIAGDFQQSSRGKRVKEGLPCI